MGEDELGWTDFGSPLADVLGGDSPTFNLGNSSSNALASETYNIGLLSGQSGDTAAYNAASVGNALSAQMGTLPGQSGSNGATTSAPGTGNTTGTPTISSSTITRAVAVVVGVVLVIGALYLFGSSAISDAIGGAVTKLKGVPA